MIQPDFIYAAEIHALHDGDTGTVSIDCGFNLWMFNQQIRLYGINAPELKVAGVFNPAGLAARDALVALLTSAPTTVRTVFGSPTILFSVPTKIVLQTIKDKSEKYGRWLGILWFTKSDGTQININDWLVAGGFAVPYLLS